MGIAVGDCDNDELDFFITTFANDNYILFHNDGGGLFTDVSYPAGIGEATVPHRGWATFFFDYHNDGHLDIFCANGHVLSGNGPRHSRTYRQPLQLLRNLGTAVPVKSRRRF